MRKGAEAISNPLNVPEVPGIRRKLPYRWALLLTLTVALRDGAAAAQGGTTETVGQALCRLIEASAKERDLPVSFFTRLIWQESGFRTTAISPVGAQGVAQFMPATAQERGLVDPFDPEQAIPAAASFLAELAARFLNYQPFIFTYHHVVIVMPLKNSSR